MLPTLKLNSNEAAIIKAVKYLIGYSASIAEADEFYNELFISYTKTWQKNHGLSADGTIGPKTWTKISTTCPTVSTAKNKKSVYACALQLLLNIDADGIFGSKTKAAVSAFQASSKLVADGICGPKTWKALICGIDEADTADYVFVQPPNFKQYDSRWGKKMYSNHNDASQTMASSACGPTSGADIVAEWWDVNVTPYDLAQQSLKWGTRTYDSGTSSTFFKKLAAMYGASQYLPTTSIQTAISCLRNGGYVVVCFGPGTKGKSSYQKWTKGGHYCCLWKYDGTYFYINDPASSASKRAKGTYDEVLDARKGFYCFWK